MHRFLVFSARCQLILLDSIVNKAAVKGLVEYLSLDSLRGHFTGTGYTSDCDQHLYLQPIKIPMHTGLLASPLSAIKQFTSADAHIVTYRCRKGINYIL